MVEGCVWRNWLGGKYQVKIHRTDDKRKGGSEWSLKSSVEMAVLIEKMDSRRGKENRGSGWGKDIV